VKTFIRMIAYICYYGHTQNTSNLGKNILINYMLGALVEIPSWSAPWLIERFGRKPPLMLAFTLSGLAGVLYAAFINISMETSYKICFNLQCRIHLILIWNYC